jgi:hypothetical protein
VFCSGEEIGHCRQTYTPVYIDGSNNDAQLPEGAAKQ